MARKKSATARRREGMADNTPTRALVLPLALSPDQHAMYSRLADLYNRVWGSAVSWYDAKLGQRGRRAKSPLLQPAR